MAENMSRTAKNTSAVADSAKRIAKNSDAVTKRINGVQIISNSLVDRVDYHMKFTQAAIVGLAIEVHQGLEALKKIGAKLDGIYEEMMNSNGIKVQGSGGPDGFARHVYDFVEEATEQPSDKHRFFVYHPDTDWYPAFRRLFRRNPLPTTFCAKSDDLDKLCVLILEARKNLIKESDDGKHVVFHLLVPA
ncbi:uncharacterized protein BDZ99DRAFT_558025 [Mytilinidion resinicola]|uniref:Uncharacterized protein n=1 Tax=Mytilinidion resinicola TaxID=574789 RepID=A0A6A6YWB5_9PEZI|nr:uncharacterized protein BDZ99DRAFT_558025 [Mytilinidion resinicola]KAF2812187.1 hypothetical protein BDZ99DRAFT_558025 [Mytilinidion resinicola]